MDMAGIAFGTTDWSSVERTEHQGDTGMAYCREVERGPGVAAGSAIAE